MEVSKTLVLYVYIDNNNNNIVNTKNNRTNLEFTYEQQHALLVDPYFLFIKTNQHELRERLEDEDPFLFINNRTHTEIALKLILFNWADQIRRLTYRNCRKAQ